MGGLQTHLKISKSQKVRLVTTYVIAQFKATRQPESVYQQFFPAFFALKLGFLRSLVLQRMSVMSNGPWPYFAAADVAKTLAGKYTQDQALQNPNKINCQSVPHKC